MKSLFIIVLIFQSLTAFENRDGDPFIENPRVNPHKVVNASDYRITNPSDPAVLYYFDIPSLRNPPTALKKMPKITANSQWKNTTSNDIVYDISTWFPAVKTTKTKKLWVYFNQSKGFIITSADKWLYISVREFIINSLETEHKQIRLTIDYLTVDSKTKPTLTTFQKCLSNQSAIRHVHFSTLCQSGESISQQAKNASFLISTNCYRYRANLDLFFDSPLYQIESNLTLEYGKTLIIPIGINLPNKKSYLVISADLVNMQHQVIKIPKRSPVILLEDESPFGDGPCSIQFYSAPFDFHRAMGKIKQLVIKDHELFNPTDTLYDVTERFNDYGIPFSEGQWAIFNANRGYIAAFNSAENHDLLNHFSAQITSLPPYHITSELSFYSVNPRKPTDKDYDLDLLLQSNPKKILSIDSALRNSTPRELCTQHSKVNLEAYLHEAGDYYLKFKLDIQESSFVFKTDLECMLHKNEPTFIELDIKYNRRPVVMMVRVTNAPHKQQ